MTSRIIALPETRRQKYKTNNFITSALLLIAPICVFFPSQVSATVAIAAPVTEMPVPENGLGAIEGRIMGSLLPLKGVKVVLLRNEEVVDETISDEEGYYRFPLLSPGKYNMKGKKEGHRVSITTEIPVARDLITKVDFYLPKMDDDNRSKFPIVETYEYKSNITGFKRIPEKQGK